MILIWKTYTARNVLLQKRNKFPSPVTFSTFSLEIKKPTIFSSLLADKKFKLLIGWYRPKKCFYPRNWAIARVDADYISDIIYDLHTVIVGNGQQWGQGATRLRQIDL
jgi:hypothetical protein